VNTENRDGVVEFVNRLFDELIERGERETREGHQRLPVSQAHPFEELRTFYIRGHQHQLSDGDFKELVSSCYEKTFGHLKNYQMKTLPDNPEP
jgi:hypothetical protein